MPRNLAKEWVARHDNQAIPEQVKRRILQSQLNAAGVPVCPDCGNEIRPGQKKAFDHKTPLADGGAHAEANLRAIHEKPCHQIKTSGEAAKRADERSQFIAIHGLKTPKKPFPKRMPYVPNVKDIWADLEEIE